MYIYTYISQPYEQDYAKGSLNRECITFDGNDN